MNTPIEPKAEIAHPQVDEKRRRLAKGGLAAPIVLGTLLSRPVLGAAPYNCTISGKMSGNVSSHGDPVPCTSLGLSPGYWKNHEAWPTPYLFGAPAAGQCPVDASSTGAATPGTRFNQAAALGSTFLDVFRCVAITETKTKTETETTYTNGQCLEYSGKSGNCKTYAQIPNTTTSTVQTGSEVVSPSDPRFSTGVSATLLQVLQTEGGLNDTAKAALGRAAVASLLNAANFAPNFPLTGKQVVDMFNATCDGGVYPINDAVSWNADQVKQYFESLYGAK